MFKRINLPGMIILVVALAAIQLGVGLFVSPILKTVIVNEINKRAGSEIAVEKLYIWPLTLSATLKGVKVSDPKRNEKIVEIGSVSTRLSFWALLRKRVVLSAVSASDATVYLKREPDGSFNIQALGQSEEQAKAAPAGAALGRFKAEQDWFGRIYDVVKSKFSKQAADKEREERKGAGKVKREVTELPRGKMVEFRTVRDDYLFEIRRLNMKNARIHMQSEDGQAVDVEKAGLSMGNLAMDPKKGARFDALDLRGELSKSGKHAGSFSLAYAKSFSRGTLKAGFNARAKNVDLAAINFVYDDSLPVEVNRGTLSITSDTDIVNGDINSNNSLVLKNQGLAAKSGGQQLAGFVPMPMLVEALNKVDPLDLKFRITGTVDNPKFEGLEDMLLKLARPYLEDIQKQGVQAVGDMLKEKLGMKEAGEQAPASGDAGEESVEKAVDAIKGLFGKDKE